jgi:DNA-binding transcriptional LysR family regulator
MDSSDIDLLTLRGFCALMDERSVSRAATRLHVSQPTMSRLLGKLRLCFADPLLVWAGGNMVPTPRALSVDTELRQVIKTIDQLLSPDRPFDPESSESTVVLAAAETLENIFLADVIKRVAAQAPHVTIEVRSPNRWQDPNALELGEIDFVVGWQMAPAPSLRSRLLFTDRLVCIARADHPILRDGELTYEKYLQLAQIQYDVPGKTTTDLLLEEKLSQRGYRRNVKFRVQSSLTVAEVVASSDLIATLPEKIASRFLKQHPLKILELPIRLPQMQNRAFWHERMQSDPRSRWFRKLLADVAQSF